MFEFRFPDGTAQTWSGELLTIGRDASNGWVLAVPGVWPRHAEVRRAADGRLTVKSLGDAVVSVNGVPVRESVLHWGDLVALGSAAVRFYLRPPVQRGLRGWERSLWALLALCALGQAIVVVVLRR